MGSMNTVLCGMKIVFPSFEEARLYMSLSLLPSPLLYMKEERFRSPNSIGHKIYLHPFQKAVLCYVSQVEQKKSISWVSFIPIHPIHAPFPIPYQNAFFFNQINKHTQSNQLILLPLHINVFSQTNDPRL